MKITGNEYDLKGRGPQNIKSGISQHISKGKFIGNPKGNLECGSAQPSLFVILFKSSTIFRIFRDPGPPRSPLRKLINSELFCNEDTE